MWVDPTLDAWPENDFRLFVGNFGPEVSEEMLAAPFRRFASFTKCRVVHPKIGHGKIRPYGFLSFLEPMDALAVLKTMQGAYIGTRPITIQKSNWIERNLDTVRAHERQEKKARK
jgi:RNA recognition motif-containing protein